MLYPAGISTSEAKICKYLTKLTQRKIILILLKKELVTSIEIREFLKKSPSVISVNLNLTLQRKNNQ